MQPEGRSGLVPGVLAGVARGSGVSSKGRQFCSFVFHKVQNMASFDIFKCIENILLKLLQKISETLVLTQILIEYKITIMECRALTYSVGI